MEPSEIRVGAAYRNQQWERWRRVDAIRNELVTYSVQGVRSLTPMTMPLSYFAEWAEEEIAEDGHLSPPSGSP